MHVQHSDQAPALSAGAIDELNKLFAQIPPTLLRDAVIKLYLCYATSEDADLPQDVEKIDKPVQVLIEALGKMIKAN